ncbi:hypothetical protein L917_07661, partial [Phytophthora nicotianae]
CGYMTLSQRRLRSRSNHVDRERAPPPPPLWLILTINWKFNYIGRGANAMVLTVACMLRIGLIVYLSRHVLSSEDAVIAKIKTLSETGLEKVCYKLFCYVFLLV